MRPATTETLKILDFTAAVSKGKTPEQIETTGVIDHYLLQNIHKTIAHYHTGEKGKLPQICFGYEILPEGGQFIEAVIFSAKLPNANEFKFFTIKQI